MKGLGWLLLSFTLCGLRGQAAPPAPTSSIRINELVEGCARTEQRDELCKTLVHVKQVGEDAVEAVKAFVHLGPMEYAVLTAGNFAMTGRLRVKMQPLISKQFENTIDLRRDGSVTFILEKSL